MARFISSRRCFTNENPSFPFITNKFFLSSPLRQAAIAGSKPRGRDPRCLDFKIPNETQSGLSEERTFKDDWSNKGSQTLPREISYSFRFYKISSTIIWNSFIFLHTFLHLVFSRFQGFQEASYVPSRGNYLTRVNVAHIYIYLSGS